MVGKENILQDLRDLRRDYAAIRERINRILRRGTVTREGKEQLMQDIEELAEQRINPVRQAIEESGLGWDEDIGTERAALNQTVEEMTALAQRVDALSGGRRKTRRRRARKTRRRAQ